MRAGIRNLWGETTTATLVPLDVPGVVCVNVPGLGYCIVAVDPPRQTAIHSQGPGTERELPCREVDGGLEVELLPNSSGEDRIVVVVWP